MVLLVGQSWKARFRRKTGTRFFRIALKNLEFERRGAPKKEARPRGPGTPYALQRNIVRNHQKTMACFALG